MDPTQPTQPGQQPQWAPPSSAPQALPPDATPWSPMSMGAQVQPGPAGWAPGVSTYPVQPQNHRFRWAAALGLCLVVVMVTVVGAFVLSGAGSANKAITAGYAPQSTLAFVDLRADLPGDQHQNLADFMSHFPGFKDRAQFDAAFDDVLNRVTGSISPDLTYTSALRSWTTGEVSLALTNISMFSLPTPRLNGSNGLEPSIPSISSAPQVGVLIVAIKDRAAGEAFVSSEISKTGTAFTPQDYAGTKLYVAGAPNTTAYAFTDKVLIAGDVTSVKAALDAPVNGSLSSKSSYDEAMRSLSGDSIATFYIDTKAILPAYLKSMSGLGIDPSSLGVGELPAWEAGSIRTTSDRVLIEIKTPKTAKTSNKNKESELAPRLPGSTVAVMEIHSIGPSLNDGLDAMLKNAPASQKGQLQQIKDALQAIGGINWIGDGAVALTDVDGQLGGGLVIKTTDASTATAKKAMFTNLISLGGSSYGIKSSDETYKGSAITVVTIPGKGLGLGSGDIKIGIAAKDDLLIAGYGDEFAKSIIDTTADSSLAAQADFKTTMAAVGSSNSGYMYWNVPATAGQIFQTSMSSQLYNLNYKPYVDHLGGVAFASVDGDLVTVRLVVMAR